MSDMKNIFSADPKSTFALLSQPGLGFYIPAYQRPYSWGKENTLRLVEDVVHGVDQLRTNAGDAITFLGTMILIHDIKYLTVEPQVKGELPTRVMLVIDGQQRITTLLLLNAALHGEINARVAILGKKGVEPEFGLEWIRQRGLQTRADLAMTLYQDMNYGEPEYQYYPRVIRAYEDSWSRHKSDVRYQSSIARFLHEYGLHARTNESKNFAPDFSTDSGSETGSNQALIANWKAIRTQLRNLAEGKIEEMPAPSELGQAAQNAMFQQELPIEVVELLTNTTLKSAKVHQAGRELLSLVLFARYLLERVAVTEVVAKDEQYAFDIFEALNTSGEPLTAFDTFKPRVIKSEDQAKYGQSPSFLMMGVIEAYLDQYKKAPEKHDATSRLLIPFALAETGEKLSKRLRDQRRYLKDEYDKQSDLVQKRSFVQHFSYAADFLQRFWPDDSGTPPHVPEFSVLDEGLRESTMMCIEVLRAAKHAVTIGPLVRFLARTKVLPPAERPKAVIELAHAIRAVTAFFALWRGSRPSTGNIDGQYRMLMSKGLGEVHAFCRRAPDSSVVLEEPRIDRLRIALRHALRDPEHGAIPDRDTWVKRVSEQAIYDAMAVAKFILFAATHNSHVDPAGGGLIVAAKDGTLDLLKPTRWHELSIEHVAPQKKKDGGWDAALYDDPAFRDKLGNLTLLPCLENSSLSNRPWKEKKLIYSILSAPTAEALTLLQAEAKPLGIDLQTSTAELLEKSRFHPQLAALGATTGEWTKELIENRSRRLAELAWQQVSPWLGIAQGKPV